MKTKCSQRKSTLEKNRSGKLTEDKHNWTVHLSALTIWILMLIFYQKHSSYIVRTTDKIRVWHMQSKNCKKDWAGKT